MTILNKEKILEQARTFIEEGKLDKAIREYEKILLSDPTDMRVKLRIAELYTKRKQVNDAIRVYREVAANYTEEGFFLKAVTVYKNILRINPSLMEINEQLAALYEKMGLSPDAIRQYGIVANALERRGEFERVLQVRTKIVELDPENPQARTRLAETYQREGKLEEALDQYEALAEALEQKGGEEPRLMELYEKILLHRPDRLHMLRALIELYNAAGEKRKALKWLEAAKEVTPYDPHLLGMQADIYASLNQIETARTKYLALADLHKEQGHRDEALKAYGHILLMMPGEEERLRKHIEELGEQSLDDLQAWLAKRRQEIADETKRQEDAERMLKETKQQKDEEIERMKLEGIARERQEKMKKLRGGESPSPAEIKPEPMGLPPRAPLPQKKVSGSIKEADAVYHLAMAYRRMGLVEEARGEFEKAQALYVALTDPAKREEIAIRLKEIEGCLRGVVPPPVPSHPAEEDEKPKQSPSETKPKKKASYV